MTALAERATVPGLRARLARLFNYEERSAGLFRLKLTRPTNVPFVGVDNYVVLLRDPGFWAAAGRTAYFAVVVVAATTLLALFVALLLNETFRGRRIVAALLLVPW